MPLRTYRLLQSSTLATGDTIPLSDVADLADATILEIVVNVEQAATGTAPKLRVQHAAMNQEGAWLDFGTAAEVDLSATGRTWFHEDAFTRLIGWTVYGVVESSPVVTVDLIAES